MQQKRDLIPALVPNALHAERIFVALGGKGTAAVGDVSNAPHDPVEAALDSWEAQIRTRLRSLAQRQAAVMVTRVPNYSRTRTAPLSGTRGDNHDLVAKIEHCKTLLAATNSARKSHRKLVELRKLMYRYRNRTGDAAQVEQVQEQMKENEAYVQRILVMLEEEGKLALHPEATAAFGDPNAMDAPRPPSSSSKRPVAASSSRKEKSSPKGTTQAETNATTSADTVLVDQLWSAATTLFWWKSAARLSSSESEERILIERASHDSLLDLTLARTMMIHF
ncbi:Hypothetical protein, putative [Bodo saltans]|uniref:Uncharacterized protein n=1 Tax=Bodo saltans TaxID=75058 RepID=A0A0S4JB21_BODSA|nr:Hypothetical protein, putative [Bodo saltans]|eukprot:CUG88770.1 Hypothetical protein, putative [Bodo saltans]